MGTQPNAPNRQSRYSAVVNPNYEQVSIKEIVSRFKDKSHKRRRSVKLEDEISAAKEDVEERAEYYLEAPKSGLLDKEEVIQPIFLPTACESINITVEAPVSRPSTDSSGKKLEEIRNLIYCRDSTVADEYQEKLRSKGSTVKQHFGLQFESNFECGNLFQAESVVRKGAPIGSPEEYDLFLRMDPSSHPTLYPQCAQWFFFRILNTKKRSYRFNIHFFTNGKIGFTDGKRPMMISQSAFEGGDKEGWRHCGENVTFDECYQKPLLYRPREELPDLDGPNRPRLYTLSFTFQLKQSKDTVYFAYEVPYTHTQLQNFIYVLSKNPFNRKHLQIRTLCRSLAGNRTDILVITENSQLTRPDMLERDDNGEIIHIPYSLKDVLPSNISALSSSNPAPAFGHHRPTTATSTLTSMTSNSHTSAASAHPLAGQNARHNRMDTPSPVPDGESNGTSDSGDAPALPRFLMKLQTDLEEQREKDRRNKMEKARKSAIFVIARVHPNETCSSWICEGIIRFLLSEHQTATLLRERFTFYIVPMVNIDGVVNGYSRHDIVGYDLGTQWFNPSPVMHPALFGIKYVLRRLQATTKIAGFIDLRGHSHRAGFSFHSQLNSSPQNGTFKRSTPMASGQPRGPRDSMSMSTSSNNNNNDDSQDPEHFDPRLFYYAAARRCKYVTLRHCHVSRHVPHYPASTDPHHGHHFHHDFSRNASRNPSRTASRNPSMQSLHDGKKLEWWQTKDASPRMIVTHQLHVGLSLTVEASTYRSAPTSAHNPEIKYLTPADYAVFGSQLCLSFIETYLAKESEVQHRLSNTSFMIPNGSSGKGPSSGSPNRQQLQNMAEILQNLPAMLDQDEDGPDDGTGPKVSPYETATAEIRRPRRQRYKSMVGGGHRISFSIGSSDVDENLKRMSMASTTSAGGEAVVDEGSSLIRRSEVIDIDNEDIQRIDFFNEDLWERESQASSDADNDHVDRAKILASDSPTNVATSVANHLSHLQAHFGLLPSHSHHLGPGGGGGHDEEHPADRLSYLSVQSQDVVQRGAALMLTMTTSHTQQHEEYPPQLWKKVRRAEYLGLIAPQPITAEEADEDNEDNEDAGTKRSAVGSAATMSLPSAINTEHVFRMGAVSSSFKPIKVMTHSDRESGVTSQGAGEVADATATATNGDLRKTAADGDEDGDATRKESRQGDRASKRNGGGGKAAKRSLIQFSFGPKTTESTTTDASAAADDSMAGANHGEDAANTATAKGGDVEDASTMDDDSDTASVGASAKAAIHRASMMRPPRKTMVNKAAPHAPPKHRSTIASIQHGDKQDAKSSSPTSNTASPTNLPTEGSKDHHGGSKDHEPSEDLDGPPSPAKDSTDAGATTTTSNNNDSPTSMQQRGLRGSMLKSSSPRRGTINNNAVATTTNKGATVVPTVVNNAIDRLAMSDDTSSMRSIAAGGDDHDDGFYRGLSMDSISSVSASVANSDQQQFDEQGVAGTVVSYLPVRNAIMLPTVIPPAPLTSLTAIEKIQQSESAAAANFTQQLTQIIEKAVEETPCPALAPSVQVSSSVVDGSSTVRTASPAPTGAAVPVASIPITQPVAPFAEKQQVHEARPLMSTTATQTDGELEERVLLARPKKDEEATETVPSIAYAAYPGELPAGYTPQKRRGRRAMSVITQQFGGGGGGDVTRSSQESAVTVQQIEAIVSGLRGDVGGDDAEDTAASQETNSTTARDAATNANGASGSDPTQQQQQQGLPSALVNASPALPAKKLKKTKRVLDTKNPLLLTSYGNDLDLPPVDEDHEKDAEFNVTQSILTGEDDPSTGLPALPSLSGLSNEQLQRAIAFAAIKQREQAHSHEAAVATSAMVLPLVSPSALLPRALLRGQPTGASTTTATIPRGVIVSSTHTSPDGKASSLGPHRSLGHDHDDEELGDNLSMLGRHIHQTEPRVPNANAGTAFLGEDYPSRGILSSSASRHRKRRVQIIREYLKNHHHHYGASGSTRSKSAASSGFPPRGLFSTEVPDDGLSPRFQLTHGEPTERTIVNEEGHRVHFVSTDTAHAYRHRNRDDGHHLSREQQQASLVSSSLQSWRDHHHQPLAKTLAVSFIPYQAVKLSAAEQETYRIQEARRKCLRELGLTYDYVFGGVGALKNRPPPDMVMHKSTSTTAADTTQAVAGGGGSSSMMSVSLPKPLREQQPLSQSHQQQQQQQQQQFVTSSEASLLLPPSQTTKAPAGSTNVPPLFSATLPTTQASSSSTMDQHRPLGPRGTFHKGFPQRGGRGRRYELSYATDSAAYRLHAYYQHILHELQQRQLVSAEELETTATQLFETVLTDPLHRGQVPVTFASSSPDGGGGGSGGGVAEPTATTTSGMSLSLTVVPPAKQLTPYRRFVKRPTPATNAPPSATADSAEDDKGPEQPLKDPTATEDTPRRRRDGGRQDGAHQQDEAQQRRLQERLQRVAVVQAEQARAQRKEQAHYLPEAAEHRLAATAGIATSAAIAAPPASLWSSSPLTGGAPQPLVPEWLSLSPRLRKQHLAGQSALLYQAHPEEWLAARQRRPVPWFHTPAATTSSSSTTAAGRDGAATTDAEAVTAAAAAASTTVPTIPEEEDEVPRETTTDEATSQHAATEPPTTKNVPFDDDGDDAAAADTSHQQATSKKATTAAAKEVSSKPARAPAAKIQTMQLFSGFDVLVPPVQLPSQQQQSRRGSDTHNDATTTTTAAKGGTDSFQERIRQSLLAKYRAHEEQQRQFQAHRLQPHSTGTTTDAADRPMSSERPEAAHDRGGGDGAVTTVRRLAKQQEYLETGVLEELPPQQQHPAAATKGAPSKPSRTVSFHDVFGETFHRRDASSSTSTSATTTSVVPTAAVPAVSYSPRNVLATMMATYPAPAPGSKWLASAGGAAGSSNPRSTSPSVITMTLPEFHSLSSRYPPSPTHAAPSSPPPHGSDVLVASAPRSYINSAGSEKPMTPFVDLPPAHTPPAHLHELAPLDDTATPATRNSASAGRQAARHRLNDIQRLTAAISIPAARLDNKNRSSSDALVMQGDKAARSAVALEVAARRPGGKKVLFVQRQLTTGSTSSPTSTTMQKKAAASSFNDEDDSLEGGSSILTLDNSPSNTNTPRESLEQRKKVNGGPSSTMTTTTTGASKNPVIVIRAAASIEATERERNRAGAIGRLLVGKSSESQQPQQQQQQSHGGGNQKEDQVSPPSPSASSNLIPTRPSGPRPSASTTTTTTATHPLDKGPNGAFAVKNPKKAKLKAESIIDKLRQTSIA
eukprot:gene9101-6544_t